jgi:hypothetical protein
MMSLRRYIAIRFEIGRFTTKGEIDYVLKAVRESDVFEGFNSAVEASGEIDLKIIK